MRSAFTFTLPHVGGEILPDQARCPGRSATVRDSQRSRSHCTMSVSALSPSRALGGVSGLLQVVSLLGLVLLLLKAAQLYLHRQWLLKALHHFPSPPSHWFYGHKREVGWSWMGEWESREGWRSRAWSHSASSYLALCLPESTDVQSDGSAPWVHCVWRQQTGI